MGSLLCIRWCPSCSSVSRGQVPLPWTLTLGHRWTSFKLFVAVLRHSCIWFHHIFLWSLHHASLGRLWTPSSWHHRCVPPFSSLLLSIVTWASPVSSQVTIDCLILTGNLTLVSTRVGRSLSLLTSFPVPFGPGPEYFTLEDDRAGSLSTTWMLPDAFGGYLGSCGAILIEKFSLTEAVVTLPRLR